MSVTQVCSRFLEVYFRAAAVLHFSGRMSPMPLWNESNYFGLATKLPPETQSALRQLYELRTSDGVRVEFGDGPKSPRFKVIFENAGSASILMPDAKDGTLFITFDFHKGNSAVVEPIGAFVRDTLGVGLPSNWRNTKPYIKPEVWVPHVGALTALLQELAARKQGSAPILPAG
jgi:hypothetical protein